jgi:hypothetical protein
MTSQHIPINLPKWIRDHRVFPKNTQQYPLTDLQQCGTVYEPIETYSEKWKHEVDKNGTMTKAFPIEGTRHRSDLPPLYIQWKQDWKRRLNSATQQTT